MAEVFDRSTRFALRLALARSRYELGTLVPVEPELGTASWLVSTQRGLYAVSEERARLVLHGWFFGIARRESRVFLFENCARRDRHLPLGRLIALDVVDGRLANPVVLAKGLDANCHQMAFIDDLLCLLDTANQCVLRFTADGTQIDTLRPFPPARAGDGSGLYMHINAITALPDGIAIMAHNGKRSPACGSELIRLDRDWREVGREALPDVGCHDIAADPKGRLWHCASETGEIACEDGRRVQVAPDRMTRGLVFGADRILVGASVFGERSVRDSLPGSIIMLDRAFQRVAEIPVGGPPADIIAL
jgi:hypothetical protein